jgi:hypothetical protein
LERMHQVITTRTAELDMADSVDPDDVAVFLRSMGSSLYLPHST